ncbi:hypothetical protein [Dyadobacter sp. CY312]|uniref:hypothetical protein n=1 Tax=Dyadobacter sp. CY312 TaxID=2907303 RepID=UPI001F39C228|nr:hypothetical protein [Dyadobacter sp. CY312]MCE7039192.1 hypothetical protein [Dyadobacter sp. CY312]
MNTMVLPVPLRLKGKNKTDEQIINFHELQKGEVFKFEGTKKVFECDGRTKTEITYFPHDNVWGDYRQTKKTSKRRVLINFEY